MKKPMQYKFRGKSISEENKGKWFFGNLIWNNGHPYIVGDVVESNEEYINLEFWEPVDRRTVGMAMNLIAWIDDDIDSMEIYDGDIISTDLFTGIYRVAYYSGCFSLKDGINKKCSLGELTGETVRVLGNKWDNPELVEQLRW